MSAVVAVASEILPLVLTLLGCVVHLVCVILLRSIRSVLRLTNLNAASAVAAPPCAEENEMKYKTFDDSRKIKGQPFTPYRDAYVLNTATNELDKLPVPKNVQEYVQSFVECALERAFERFLPRVERDDDSVIADYTQRVEDLAALGEAMDIAEDYRERFNLPDSMSIADIYSRVDKEAHKLKERLSELGKKKEVEKDET